MNARSIACWCLGGIALLAACARPAPPAPAPDPGPPPTGKLPAGVTPTAYRLELTILPGEERFSGRTQIDVRFAAPAAFVWLHGRDLRVGRAVAQVGARSIPGRFTQVDEDGLARIDFDEALPAGDHALAIEYDAPFNRQLTGLYKVEAGGAAYAFTQFEPTSARLAFPSFDEPRFKTPFDVTLTVAADGSAVGNTPELASDATPDGRKRVRFATTQPLPTYLVAFVVGPLDVVSAPPIAASEQRPTPLPLRGVAVKGQGARLRYALEHTGPLVLELERYFGLGYPYEKLDIIAVPDFAAGAMENAGAITFRDRLLFIDPETAPESQLRSYANVMAHELAHHWTGDLVTMPWWDDIWLNEAFATFMASRTVAAVHPEHRSLLAQQSSVQGVMDGDSRQSARRIRQPIESTHDISNAFDGITYQKGAGVIGMFERWLGAETFRAGVQAHLRAHLHGVASSAELLAALGAVAGKEVAGPFATFLDQPGVPLIRAELRCAKGRPPELALAQKRYLPLGSTAQSDQVWRVPVCVRYPVGKRIDEQCTLLESREAVLPLRGDACPAWVMPNADGAGYYRWALPDAELAKLLRSGYARLGAREKISLADSLIAGFESGALSPEAVLRALPILADDADRSVATMPMELLGWIREYALDAGTRADLDVFARELYRVRLKQIGWTERPGESGEQRLLRNQIISFLALTVRHPAMRSWLNEVGTPYLAMGGKAASDALPRDLVGLALTVTLQEGDAATFDRALARLRETRDPVERERLLGALASVSDARSSRALALTLDPVLRGNEVLVPLRYQSGDERTREAAFQYLEQNIDAIVQRISPERAGGLPSLAAPFCSRAAAERAQALFESRIARLRGGPRALASTLEGLALCAARLERLREPSAAFFRGPVAVP